MRRRVLFPDNPVWFVAAFRAGSDLVQLSLLLGAPRACTGRRCTSWRTACITATSTSGRGPASPCTRSNTCCFTPTLLIHSGGADTSIARDVPWLCTIDTPCVFAFRVSKNLVVKDKKAAAHGGVFPPAAPPLFRVQLWHCRNAMGSLVWQLSRRHRAKRPKRRARAKSRCIPRPCETPKAMQCPAHVGP